MINLMAGVALITDLSAKRARFLSSTGKLGIANYIRINNIIDRLSTRNRIAAGIIHINNHLESE